MSGRGMSEGLKRPFCPSTVGCALASLGHSLACVQLSAEVWSSEHRCVWSRCVHTHISNFGVSGPKFTALFATGIAVDHVFFRFWICPSVAKIFAMERKWSEIAPNFAYFGHQFFWKRAPKFWDPNYKIQLTYDHVAKFHGERIARRRDICRVVIHLLSAATHLFAKSYFWLLPGLHLTFL